MPVFQTWALQSLCNYTSCSSMPLLFSYNSLEHHTGWRGWRERGRKKGENIFLRKTRRKEWSFTFIRGVKPETGFWEIISVAASSSLKSSPKKNGHNRTYNWITSRKEVKPYQIDNSSSEKKENIPRWDTSALEWKIHRRGLDLRAAARMEWYTPHGRAWTVFL